MKYVIINDLDRSSRRYVAEKVGDYYYYMARTTHKELMDYRMSPKNPTPLEDFGFKITESENEVLFEKVRDGNAKYSDGEPRKWQGESTSFTLPRVRLTNKELKKNNRVRED